MTRELSTADDPMAVLVWAAGTHAVNELTRAAEQRAERDERSPAEKRIDDAAEDRLRIVDTALARQRDQRLEVAAADLGSPVAGLVGIRPSHQGGRVPWDRAALAIIDYRDRAGIYDQDNEHPDPWTRALGRPPNDPALANHWAQTRDIVLDARTAIVLADLPGCVPEQPGRPLASVAEQASPTLAELARQEQQLRATQHFGDTNTELGPPTADIEQLRLVQRAYSWRRTRLITDVLNAPPQWLRTAIRTEIEHTGEADPKRWAGIAAKAAVWTDLSEKSPDVDDLSELIGRRPSDPSLQHAWDALAAELAPAAVTTPVDLDTGVDLGH